MKKAILILAVLMASTSMAFAHGDEMHHMDSHKSNNPCSTQGMDGMTHNPCDMSGQDEDKMAGMSGPALIKKEVDGYTVSFHIMKAKEGMEHGGSHNVMIKVEKDGKLLTDLVANSKVSHPNGKSESKMLMKMGDWYMTSYDLDHPGNHQLMILFKTPDGAKHFVGIYYPEDKQE
ncbi:MAG TPA: hypothetical protein VKA31_08630 [Mariprofundaceae bacterium]|nr:hypothetical protein [Mariprofundaceae bacterium]